MIKTKNFSVFLQVLGCVAFLLLPELISPNAFRHGFWRSPDFRRDLFVYVLMIVFFYLNYFYLIPRLYFKGKHVLFFSLIFILFCIVIGLPSYVFPHVNPPHRSAMEESPLPPDRFVRHEPEAFLDILRMETRHHVFVFLSVFFISMVLRINNRLKKTEQEKLNAELSYLKAQINPHFLFNTLNSIYSLAIAGSDKTASAIVQLSGMIRYVISDTQNDYISLEKELNYIKAFIDLQEIRFGDTIKVDFEIIGDSFGKKIAPLLLVPFIENTFKHGIDPEEDSRITILILIKDQELEVAVRNTKFNKSVPKYAKSGMGIENTTKRLQLLYPGKHLLNIKETDDEFIVNLHIIF